MTQQTPEPPQPDPTKRQNLKGVGLSPRQILSVYDATQWEAFINEWTESLRSEYEQVQRFSGAGDKGRDVVGFVNNPASNGPWDNYQCKHYSAPLTPSEIWLELGKLCYFCYNGDYSPPRRYRLVAPHEVGPKLKDLLLKPNDLRSGLIQNWKNHCEKGITATAEIPLDASLLAYVERFDFTIIGYSPLLEIIEQHRKTPHWSQRFHTVLPPRPPAEEPPDSPTPNETRYLQKLLEAYGEAEGKEFKNLDDISTIERFGKHLKRSRQWFFQAEALNRFSRDNYQNGAFEQLKQQVFDGIIDITEKVYPHGFERVCATTDHAGGLALGNSSLAPLAAVADKKGICHHLANDDRLDWAKKK